VFEERIGASVSPAPGSKGQGERPRKQATLPASGLALEEAARAGHAASLRPRAREGGRCWPAAKPAAPTERAPARCGLCRRRCRLDASAVVGARGTEIAEHTLEAQEAAEAPKIYVCADCPSCAADWPLRPTRQPTRRGLSGRGQRVAPQRRCTGSETGGQPSPPRSLPMSIGDTWTSGESGAGSEPQRAPTHRRCSAALSEPNCCDPHECCRGCGNSAPRARRRAGV
ncbi:unnamed protein product, partial [Prorocentrum cordatum]